MRRLLPGLALLAAACQPGETPPSNDTGLDGLALQSVQPDSLVPGSLIVLGGTSFVNEEIGTTRLRLRGTFEGSPVDVSLPARFMGYQRLEVDWPGGLAAGLPADRGVLWGEALLEVDSAIDGRTHESVPRNVTLSLEPELAPRLDQVVSGQVIFINEPIAVEGEGLLLGGAEGQTFAVVDGCFQLDGSPTCAPLAPHEVPVVPEPFDRTRGAFAFEPHIAGIQPGTFSGTVHLRNRHGDAAGGAERDSAPVLVECTTTEPAVFSVSPSAASLGQYVTIEGGGFVGAPAGSPDAATMFTTLELAGTFRPEGTTETVPASLMLVPEFISGPVVRYVLSADDGLGVVVDLRRGAGSFTGTIRPVVSYGGDTVAGMSTPVAFDLAHVKQVVWLNFMPSYVESLRHLGLRAMDRRIRDRVLEVARRDYAGVNIEFREEPPEDFALYSQVDIVGRDPNGLGLMGYDNTPGKDVDNLRLYDQIGGVNAETQQDGYPGYGGVFVESFFAFSKHPGTFATMIDGADALFDTTFDPFRPDVGGRPVLSADLAVGIPTLSSGAGCPATDRPGRIACAVWVFGSMVGTTLTHEIGHSLGLANPYGEGYHNPGDQVNRLMDAGGARTFRERAELQGEGPAVFCDSEYEYLRTILPSSTPAPSVTRPTCY